MKINEAYANQPSICCIFCTNHLPRFPLQIQVHNIIAGFTTSTQTDIIKQVWVSTHYIRLRTRKISIAWPFSREKEKHNKNKLLHIVTKMSVPTTLKTHLSCASTLSLSSSRSFILTWLRSPGSSPILSICSVNQNTPRCCELPILLSALLPCPSSNSFSSNRSDCFSVTN